MENNREFTVLGIETSCDETAVCALQLSKEGQPNILAEQVASQHETHAPHGGVVPELASRRHSETLAPMVTEVIESSGLSLEQLNGIAVTHRPGLLGSLLVGLSFAKSLAWRLEIPFLGVSHLEAHLNAPFLEFGAIPYPHTGLLVSGGHTANYHCRDFGTYELIGATRDDAAGEAYDKVAKMLKLGYPGGPIIDRLAKEGNPEAISFPHGEVRGRPHDFSFSGLKTAVARHIQTYAAGGASTELAVLPDICASFQEAVVQTLVTKTMRAATEFESKAILLTGGVACNSRLRTVLKEAAEEEGFLFFVSSPKYCTDNAAMVAYLGARKLARGESSAPDLNAIATEIVKGSAS